MRRDRERKARKVKPVTEAKEVAMEAAERGSEPRWPTNMTEMTWREYWKRLTPMSGAESQNCFFTYSFTLCMSLLSPTTS
ncbi:hypothetical protein F2Q69_00057891 [Brassica cretica]|uniref:Uncharacterized protein n=1 Tax=Brassica cretica TaxID=69181 RepID=A0A8S9MYP0_BRACR|nr:hypothetical protein F2Q69_00057891 [Brassica cretica]